MRLRVITCLTAAAIAALVSPPATLQAQIVAPPASDQSQWTPQQRQIFQTAINPTTGHLTREMHDQFWASVIQRFGKPTGQELVRWKETIDSLAGVALEFQRETWRSAALSADAGRVVETPGYRSAQQKARDLKINGVPMAGAAEAAANGDRVLEAAATRHPLQSGGRMLYITSDLAHRIVSGLDGAIERVARLANPDWSDAPAVHEVRYDDLGLALLTDQAFTREDQKAGPARRPMSTLSRTLAEDRFVMISVSKLADGLRRLSAAPALHGIAAAAFGGMGAHPVGSETYDTFQSHDAAVASGQITVSGKPVAVSYRAVLRPERGDVVQFLAMAPDLPTAGVLRESLEQNVMLLAAPQAHAGQ